MPGTRSEHAPFQLSPFPGEVADMLCGLDVNGLHRYAGQSSLSPEPVKTLTEIALGTGRPLSNRTGEVVLREVGYQLDPAADRETSAEMALLLRRWTGEGVYPHILSAKDSWDVAADALVITGNELLPNTAQFLLLCAGVQRLPLMEAVGVNAHRFGNHLASFAQILYKRPQEQQRLADKTAGLLLPLILPEIPEAVPRLKQLGQLADKLFDEATASSFMEASPDKQQEVIDVMSLRYLDRPRSIMPRHHPWELVNRLRLYAQGHKVSALAAASNVGDPAFRKSLDTMQTHFRESLSPADIEEIRQFLAGESEQVVLERSQPLDVAFTETTIRRREAYVLHRRNMRRTTRDPASRPKETTPQRCRNPRPIRTVPTVNVPESRLRLENAFTGVGKALGLEGRDTRSLTRFVDASSEHSSDMANKMRELLDNIMPDAQDALEATELSDLHKQVVETFLGVNDRTAQSPAALLAGNPELRKSLEAAGLTAQMCLAAFFEEWLGKL